MKKNFTSKVIAGVLAAAITASPAAAVDLGLERDAETYGGAYFKVPFGGSQKAGSNDQMKFGLQADRKNGGSFSPFEGGAGLSNKAMLDMSFDTSLNMTGLHMNGVDAMAMADRLNQNDDNSQTGWLWTNIGWVFLAGTVAIIVLADDNNGDDCRDEGEGEGGGELSFAQGGSYASGGGLYYEGPAVRCDIRYEPPKGYDPEDE